VILLVLPAYNEARALPSLLARAARVAREPPGHALEAIVVDDGSDDGTSAAAASLPGLPVRVITHDRNRGPGAALNTGLRAALAEAAARDAPEALVFTMDADDTHPPELIPPMADLLRSGRDVVIASRYRPGSRVVGVPAYRRALSDGMSLLFRAAYPVAGVRDYSCGFRGYRAPVLRQAYDRWGDAFVSETGFSGSVDILIKLAHLGAACAEVPLELRYDRKPGPSKMDARRTALRTLVLLARRRAGRFD